MQSITSGPNRPNLTINTKKKRWTSIFSKKSVEVTEPLADSPTSSVFSEEGLTATDSKPKSADPLQSVFKKFHVPHFHKRAKTTEYTNFEPVAPEPIIPQLVNWSPETPLSPPPWELEKEPIVPIRKRHSMLNNQIASLFDEEETVAASTEYHSDSEIHNPTDHASDVTLVETSSRIRRSSSCPTYDSLSLTSSNSTLVDNDIMSITEQHTRHMSVFKKYTHPADKMPALKSCQKKKARAAEAAANGNVGSQSNFFLKYLYIPNVFDPMTHETILEFAAIKPRKYQLYRKTSWKREAKALMTWHYTLEQYMQEPTKPLDSKSIDKQQKNELTRKFIMREFFETEVNFWNQLYYTKVIFYDVIVNALENGSQFVKQDNVDMFANLFDLMQFSAKLINRLRHLQMDYSPRFPITDDVLFKIDCSHSRLGKTIREMAEDLVVFLRCALDYKENRKLLDSNVNNKGYLMYNQKLSTRKETSQFTMKDFLIIPIQRIARYGLLIADLIKHFEPTHPDYNDLIIAHKIITSLASAMNSVQKKNKT